MAIVLAIANQKGGVAKTTTAVNLSASLAAAEKRVLAIDMDPQGNLSSGLGYPSSEIRKEVYDVLVGRETVLDDVMLPTDLPQLSLVPATTNLTGAEIELVDVENRHGRLAAAISTLGQEFDFILIDTPPSLGLLTLNSLVAAQSVLVPLQCEYYALEGLSHLLATIDRIKQGLNPTLSLAGILFCMHDKRTNLSRQVTSEVREHFNAAVFNTIIPRNVRLGEAPSFGKPVLLYDVDSVGAKAYLQLAEELLARYSHQVDAVARSEGQPNTHQLGQSA